MCLLLVLLVGAVMLIAACVQGGRLARAAARTQRALLDVRAEGWGQGGLPSLQTMRALRRDLELLDREARTTYGAVAWLSRALARQTAWPALRSWGLVLDGGLSATADLTTTAWWVALATESAIESNQIPGVQAPGPLQPPLEAALLAMRKDRARLDHAREELARVKLGLDSLRRQPWIGSRGESWSNYLDLASLGVEAMIVAPQMVPGRGERTYLLLIQNSDELRATGGFISSVAILKFQGLKLASPRYMYSSDVEAYRVVHPLPPSPLQRYMGAGILLFRDANWSPDYPASAEVLASLFQADVGDRVDGVLAIDTYLAQLVLAALGPLSIPQYNVTVTADNVMDTTAAFWDRPLNAPTVLERQEQWQAWLEHRKDFGGALLQAGLERLARLSLQDVAHLAHAMQQGIRGKHILLWAVNNPELQADLKRTGLDGGLRDPDGDYLMVVDSNVGWNKADRHVERAISYHVTLSAEGARSRLCLDYRSDATVRPGECEHRTRYEDSYEALTQQCYWNYVRILVPSGSALRSVQGADWPVDVSFEGGKMSFGTLLVVPPAASRTLCVEYDLPSAIVHEVGKDRAYTLLVQKQPGTLATQLAVTVGLADDAALRVTSPGGLASRREVSWSRRVESDLNYELSWTPSRR